MEFQDLQPEVQNSFNTYLPKCVNIMSGFKRLKSSVPMLFVFGEGEPQILVLQPKDGVLDVDKSFEVALKIAREQKFETAVFSYATKISASPDLKHPSDAIKTVLIDQSGVAAEYFTEFTVQGFFKKKVLCGEPVLARIIENVFEQK